MNTQELRIGNLIRTTNSNRFGKEWQHKIVVLSNKGMVELIENGEETFKNFYQPVKITFDLLEECGFVKEVHDLKLNFFGYRKGNMIVYETSNHPKSNGRGFNVEYGAIYEERTDLGVWYQDIHHLQNLYYSLTGTELKFPY